jgi:hypothetical protein
MDVSIFKRRSTRTGRRWRFTDRRLKEEDDHVGLALIFRFLKRDGSYTPCLAEARSMFLFCCTIQPSPLRSKV